MQTQKTHRGIFCVKLDISKNIFLKKNARIKKESFFLLKFFNLPKNLFSRLLIKNKKGIFIKKIREAINLQTQNLKGASLPNANKLKKPY